jgi:hypothetical protein
MNQQRLVQFAVCVLALSILAVQAFIGWIA